MKQTFTAVWMVLCLAIGWLTAWPTAAGADAVNWKRQGFDLWRKGHFTEARGAFDRAREIACAGGGDCAAVEALIPYVEECRKAGRFTPRVARIILGPRVSYKGAPKGFNGIVEDIIRGEFYNTASILFVVGATDFLESALAREQIRIYADEIRYHQAPYVVNGYASDDGATDTNMVLSHRRAECVKEILHREHGIPVEWLSCNWHGENPAHFATPVRGLTGEALERARRDNRRVAIRLNGE